MSQVTKIQQCSTPRTVPLLLSIGVIALSSAPIFIRLTQGAGLPSLLIAAGRLSLAALLFTPFVLQRHMSHIRSLSLRNYLKTILASTILAVHFFAAVSSFAYTSVMVGIVVFSSTPLWTAILEYFVLRTQLSRQVIWGLLIATIGGILIGTAGQFAGGSASIPDQYQQDLVGGGLALLGAIMFAIYMIIGRDLQQDNRMPTLLYVWLVYGGAGIILLGVVAIRGIPTSGYASEGYLWLFVLTIFPQVIGHSSLNYAVGYMPATLVTMITLLEPVISTLLAYMIFSEKPLLMQLIGSAVILIGVAIGNYRRN